MDLSRIRRRWLLPAVAVAVLGVLAATTAVLAGPQVPYGVRVLGVDVGGGSRADAGRLLAAGLAGRAAEPFTVSVGGVPVRLAPADVGLAVDFPATAARVAGRGPFATLTGRDVAPVVTVDADRLYTALQPAVGDRGVPMVAPAVRYERGEPLPFYPATGRGLDRRGTARTVRDAWLRRSTVDLPIVTLTPISTRADVDRLVTDLARPAVAAPVTVDIPATAALPATGNPPPGMSPSGVPPSGVSPSGVPPSGPAAGAAPGDPGGAAPVPMEVSPEVIAASLVMEADRDGLVVPRVDEARLRTALGGRLATAQRPGRDATFAAVGGRPVIVPHVDGVTVDLAALARDLLAVLGQPAPRRITATVLPGTPAVTADQLAALGVVEQVSTFTTRFVAGQPRARNIRRIADAVRGALVRPGQTFSLNGHVGERSRAKGYVDAPVIDNGKIKTAPGGGVSQFATTLFNASYYAGLEDVEHRPHSYHFDRYPSVIEATVIFPTLDLRFRNDSPHAIWIDTSHTATSVTVSMYGTKRYDIVSAPGPRTGHTTPATVPLDEDDCNPTGGLPGFQQEVFRVFRQNGVEVRRERFFWRYAPEPRFVCAG